MAKLNITWPQFAVCNENPTKAFEDMCRRLFTAEFLKNKQRPHANHNNAGIEVLPILEAERDDELPRKRISFQCKYVDQPSYAYSEFQKSAKTTAKEYKGKLDLVYLFCNKTLTTTTKGYQSIVKTHASAGIETQALSNEEVLDMIADHQEIAEYYFQARIVADTTGLQPTVINGIPMYFVPADRVVTHDIEKPENTELLKELVEEKLIRCRNYALELEIESLKDEVEKLISFGAENGELFYYKFLTLLIEGKETQNILKLCDDVNRGEAEWLIDFYSAPHKLSAAEYRKHTPISQIFAVSKLFTPEHWCDLVGLYEELGEEIDKSIKTAFDLHYGLSLLNLQENERAKGVLHALYEKTKELRILFYDTCASIRFENTVYQNGMVGNHEVLVKLLNKLDSLKDLKQYTQQELFVAAIKMESAYHLGITDQLYLEEAIEEYDRYSETTRKNTIIQYYLALCLELNGDRKRAIKVYENIDWKTDLAISERYMISLILDGRPDRAIEIYRGLNRTTVRTEAIYLFALDRNKNPEYSEELKKAIEKYRNDPADFFVIAYYTDSETPAREVVVPVIKEIISKESLSTLQLNQKAELITFLANSREIELMETVLASIEDISVINSFVIAEIYKALFDIANKEYSREEKEFEVPARLEATERIADSFLSLNVSRRNFLQIKVLCAGAKKMPYSSLIYTKELFELTHEVEMARNIVALLFDRKETDAAEYAPYLEVLEKSEKPDHCLVVACAMLVLGREDIAEFYAYKALYLLNEKDDYNVYRGYFGFCNYNLHRFHADASVNSVKGGMVVTLEEDETEEPRRFEVCLDQESDFSDEMNRSMGIKHITPSNTEYIKLRGSGLGQVLRLGDRKYKIVQIMPRNQFGLGYIFRKIQEKPEMFRGVVWMISTENSDDMIKQIKELTDNTDHIKSLLASYHFENNEAGLPIDAIASGDYSRYIPAFKYLLYQKDEAFYAGQPIYENEEGQKYVPGLATLMLLSIIGRMDILEAFKEHIVIPESYISFFQDEYAKAAGMDQLTTSTLFFVDDKPVMMESDKDIPEIWESVLNACKSWESKKVTDKERIEFQIADGLSGERLIMGMKLNVIHLDALLLSKREKATFLCDDLFFRKIATWMGIRNLNIVSLVQHYTDPDYMVPIIKELSKTNYVYVPLRARNDDEFVEILENLLDGKKKEVFYGELIDRFLAIRDRVLREYFGEEFVDKMYAEQQTNENKE